MSAGRNPNTIKAPTINAPDPITQYSMGSPTGDIYSTIRNGNSQYTQDSLTPQTASTIQTSQSALQDLVQNLAQPDDQMYQNIADQTQNYYDLQAQNINNASDNLYNQTTSDLANRFGGAYNSTFGAMELGQIQKNRLNALYNAGNEATMYGQDLYNQDQANQINRFQVFQNYLTNQYNQAQSANTSGSNLLENEANRTQNLSIDQAKLQMQADIANQNAARQAAQRRAAILGSAIQAVGYIASPSTGGASAIAGQMIAKGLSQGGTP